MKDGHERGLYFDRDAAERVFRFFEKHLTLSDGDFEGIPFVLAPVQKFIVGSIFGWKKANGYRRFRRAYIEMGKGNGKSPLVAGIGLYGTTADDEAGSQVYAAAADKNQADILFTDAVSMRTRSPALCRELITRGTKKITRLTHLRTRSFFEPISSQVAKTGSGPRPHMALCDEVHEHPNRRIIEILERGFKFRKQPLLLMITNSGSDRNTVCWEEHEHAVKVAAGSLIPGDDYKFVGDVIDDDTFSFVCALDKDDDPLEDRSCWPKVNPLLGIILDEDYLAGVAKQAKDIPGKRNGILRLHFCVWTDSDVAWMSREILETVLHDFDPLEHAGEDILIAADLSAKTDMTALAFAVKTGDKPVERQMPDGSTEFVTAPTYDLWAEAYTPQDTVAARALVDKAPYELWSRDELDENGKVIVPKCLNLVPGKIISLRYMAAAIANSSEPYRVMALVYDRYSFKKLEEEMSDIGLQLRKIEHPQGGKRRSSPPDDVLKASKLSGEEPPDGLWFPGSLNEFELMILEGRCRIRKNAATISALMSAVIHPDPMNNRWLDKDKATNRIDIAVALCMAAGAATTRWIIDPPNAPIPFWAEEDFDAADALGIKPSDAGIMDAAETSVDRMAELRDIFGMN